MAQLIVAGRFWELKRKGAVDRILLNGTDKSVSATISGDQSREGDSGKLLHSYHVSVGVFSNESTIERLLWTENG